MGASLPLLLADRDGRPISAVVHAPLLVRLASTAAPTPPPTPTAAIAPRPTQTPAQTPAPVAICGSATVTLHGGWNLITLPVAPAGLTAESLLRAINGQGGSATAINRWQGGGWQAHAAGLPFNDFAVVAGRAAFIKAAAGRILTARSHLPGWLPRRAYPT